MNIKDKKQPVTAYVGKSRKTKNKISWGTDTRLPKSLFGANQQCITTKYGHFILKGTAVYLVPTVNTEFTLDTKIAQFKLKSGKYTYRFCQNIAGDRLECFVKALDKLALHNKAYLLDNLEQLTFDASKQKRKRKSHFKKLHRQVLSL